VITVSDSTPLIHFGTIKRLDILRSMHGQIVITKAVHREVVAEGIALGKMDAFLVEKAIGDSDRGRKSEGYAGEICSRYGIRNRGGGIDLACTRIECQSALDK